MPRGSEKHIAKSLGFSAFRNHCKTTSREVRIQKDISNFKKYVIQSLARFLLPTLAIFLLPSTGAAETTTIDQTLPPTTPSLPANPITTIQPTVELHLSQSTITSVPSKFPSVPSSSSELPSDFPAGSRLPTVIPTAQATSTAFPSPGLSYVPSDLPSVAPSLHPTAEPTFKTPITATANFRQEFAVGNGRVFTSDEVSLFQSLYTSYTVNFAPVKDVANGRTETACEVLSQLGLEEKRMLKFTQMEKTNPVKLVRVHYAMSYASVYSNVTTYTEDFQIYVNENLDTVALQLRLLGLNVTETYLADRITVEPEPTPAPTLTHTPTPEPTMKPSLSFFPSMIPTDLPSLSPTSLSTSLSSGSPSPLPFTSSVQPSRYFSGEPSRENFELREGKKVADKTLMIVSIVVAGTITLIGLSLYCRRRKLLSELEYISHIAASNRPHGLEGAHEPGSWNAVVCQPRPDEEDQNFPYSPAGESVPDMMGFSTTGLDPIRVTDGLVSPSDSFVSNQSLLSAGNSIVGDSGDEADATGNLADEFDNYKDQNLEKMRADIEGNLTDFDDMMSQALTRALIDDDGANTSATEQLWGSVGGLRGSEIEASALCDVIDWLRRKKGASIREK